MDHRVSPESALDPDSRTHTRPCQRVDRVQRQDGGDHRRHDPSPVPDRSSRLVSRRRRRQGRLDGNAPRDVERLGGSPQLLSSARISRRRPPAISRVTVTAIGSMFENAGGTRRRQPSGQKHRYVIGAPKSMADGPFLPATQDLRLILAETSITPQLAVNGASHGSSRRRVNEYVSEDRCGVCCALPGRVGRHHGAAAIVQSTFRRACRSATVRLRRSRSVCSPLPTARG